METNRHALVTDFGSCRMVVRSVIENLNTSILDIGRSKLHILTEIKNYRKNIHLKEWFVSTRENIHLVILIIDGYIHYIDVSTVVRLGLHKKQIIWAHLYHIMAFCVIHLSLLT